jgi:hypothetical protein
MRAQAVSAPVRWHRFRLAETDASDRASAACYRRTKNIFIVPIVVSVLKLSDVERHVFAADFVEGSHDAALKDRPETFNRIGVDRADNIFAAVVSDDTMRIFFAKMPIAAVIVGRDQTNFVGHRFPNKLFQSVDIGGFDHASNDIALALDRANNSCLAGSGAASPTIALVPMFVAGFAADIGFVNLDDAHKLLKFLVLQRGADTVAHVPCRLVRAEPHVTMNLPSADAFFADQHKVNDSEPLPQVDIRVLKDRPHEVREPIGPALSTVRAFPTVRHRLKGIDFGAAAARAVGPVRPTVRHQVGIASFFSRKCCLKLRDGHLYDLLGLFSAHVEPLCLSIGVTIPRHRISVKSGIIA